MMCVCVVPWYDTQSTIHVSLYDTSVPQLEMASNFPQ